MIATIAEKFARNRDAGSPTLQPGKDLLCCWWLFQGVANVAVLV